MHKGPECHSYGITGYGDPSYGVAIVGIAPGRDEVSRSKKPFTGASGQLMDACLANAGWPRHKVYATNVICWLNNAPSPSEVEMCGDRFRRELRAVKPKLIITMGVIANQTVTGLPRRKGSRGSINWSNYWDCYVLDTHHPSGALQANSMSMVQDIIRDFTKIPLALQWPKDYNHVEWRSVTSLSEAQYVLDQLPRNTPVTLDIETSNPDPEDIDAYKDQLLCFSISWNDPATHHEHTVVFPSEIFPPCVLDKTHNPLSHTPLTSRSAVPPKHLCSYPPDVLSWPTDVHWTFQGGQYDVVDLAQDFGVVLPIMDDTMLLSYCGDERPGYHGLKPLAREFCAAGWYEEEVKPYYKGRLNELPRERVHEYNAKDSAYDLRLLPILRSRAEEDGTLGVYERVLLPATRTFVNMQLRGINVDQTRLQELAYDVWFPRFLQMSEDLKGEAQQYGWPHGDININSRSQMAELFFNILGLPVTKRTKKLAQPAVDKEVLDRIDHPFAARIREFRTLDTIIDYVLAVQNNLKHDGLLHPKALVHNTRTGRTAYQDPAMQTIPKDYTVGADLARIREIFIPHNPDTHVLLESDYRQIEVWLAWFLSKDPVLGEHLLSGDVHSATAEQAFETLRTAHSSEEWDIMRQNAKKIRFGIQYGEGAEKLASPRPVGIGCTPAQAQRFINNYWATYNVYYAWFLGIQKQARDNGYIRTPSGRVMRFPVVLDHKQLRQAVNFPIQGTANEYNLISMVELEEPLKKYNSYLMLNVHDSLVVEVDKRHVDEVAELIRTIMERPKFPGLDGVQVDQKIGPNLGMMKKYKVGQGAALALVA